MSTVNAIPSLYNRLADMEWNAPTGEVSECGGDVLFRCPVLLEVGGFNPRMIAGEEPELCVRVRERGYRILRIDAAGSHAISLLGWKTRR